MQRQVMILLALATALAGCSRKDTSRGGGTGGTGAATGGPMTMTAGTGGGGRGGSGAAGSPGGSGGAGGSLTAGTSGGATAGAGGTGGTGGATAGATGTGGGGTAAATGGSGGGDGGAMGEPRGCTGCGALEQCGPGQRCVARAVAVPAGFSIDATEVTRAQYAAWLATAPATKDQAGACAWNDSFTPDAACMARPSVCQGDGCARHPQPCVDHCDATAYCKAAGKRLCGAMSGDAPVNRANFVHAQGSRWFNACSSNGTNYITYGPDAVTGNCNDFLSFGKTTVPVASKPGCQSPAPGYTGIFDMIGNVGEWEDNCLTADGQMDICKPRGLSFGIGAALPHCSQETYRKRGEVSDEVGFRCCAP